MTSQGHVYKVPNLETLEPDPELSIWIPTAHEALVIGTEAPTDYREVAVVKDIGSFTVERIDNTPIQIVEAVFDPMLGERYRSLLQNPLPRFVLEQTAVYGNWRLVEGQDAIINGPENLNDFFDLISGFALGKQVKLAQRLEQQRINALLETF